MFRNSDNLEDWEQKEEWEGLLGMMIKVPAPKKTDTEIVKSKIKPSPISISGLSGMDYQTEKNYKLQIMNLKKQISEHESKFVCKPKNSKWK